MSKFLAVIAAALVVVVGVGWFAAQDSDASRCEALSFAAHRNLSEAIRGNVGTTYAVRSDDFSRVYFVASSVDGQPALFAMNRLDGSGLIYSINDHASEVSGFGRGQNTDSEISERDDGASEALDCIG